MLQSLLNNDPLLAVAAFFVVLIPLILVHELGHFIAARKVGITILEFAIGFPPRVRRLFTWKGTEFTLNWIPLGGFVRPLGEGIVRPLDADSARRERDDLLTRQNADRHEPYSDMDEALARGVETPRAVSDVRPGGRILFMAAGAIANFVLAVLIYVTIALTGVPKVLGSSLGVRAVEANSPLALAGLQQGDVVTAVNGEPIQSSADFFARYYSTDNSPILSVQRSVENDQLDFTVAGPSLAGSVPQLSSYAQILGLVEGAPAAVAGMQPGDIVTGLNGVSLSGVEDFRNRTRENVGREVIVTVKRDQQTLDFTMIPRVNPPEGQGALGIVIGPVGVESGLGLTFVEGPEQRVLVAEGLIDSLRYGFERLTGVILMTLRIPGQILSGALAPEDARPVSIVGMSQIGAVVLRESVEQGRLAPILDFVATVSVALGFFNLLPIPALDGGRIFFVLVEIVRGRPIAPEREGLVHLVGLALLLSFSLLVILNDFVNPVTNLIR